MLIFKGSLTLPPDNRTALLEQILKPGIVITWFVVMKSPGSGF